MITEMLVAAALLSAPSYYVNGNQPHRGALAAQKVHERRAPTQVDLDEANKFVGYVQGSVDALSVSGRICIIGDPSIGQIIEVVSDYIDTGPDDWELAGAIVVDRALQRRYLCR